MPSLSKQPGQLPFILGMIRQDCLKQAPALLACLTGVHSANPLFDEPIGKPAEAGGHDPGISCQNVQTHRNRLEPPSTPTLAMDNPMTHHSTENTKNMALAQEDGFQKSHTTPTPYNRT